jgi:hypothetical protein
MGSNELTKNLADEMKNMKEELNQITSKLKGDVSQYLNKN